MGARMLFGCIFFAVFQGVTAYNCTTCDKSKCPPILYPCPGNSAVDPCGCCVHCAKQEWEVCGGPNWELGYCDHRTRCAAINGTDLVQIPDIGVCKWLPTYPNRVEDDELCPPKYGCYIHLGLCDCYTKNTCIHDFRFYSDAICRKHTEEDFEDFDPDYFDAWKPTCWNRGCNVIEGQCACETGKCDVKYTFQDHRQCINALVSARCANVTCPELPPLKCLRLAVASKPHTPQGECCPTIPSFCTCNFFKCKNYWPPIKNNKEIILKAKAIPGRCCK